MTHSKLIADLTDVIRKRMTLPSGRRNTRRVALSMLNTAGHEYTKAGGVTQATVSEVKKFEQVVANALFMTKGHLPFDAIADVLCLFDDYFNNHDRVIHLLRMLPGGLFFPVENLDIRSLVDMRINDVPKSHRYDIDINVSGIAIRTADFARSVNAFGFGASETVSKYSFYFADESDACLARIKYPNP